MFQFWSNYFYEADLKSAERTCLGVFVKINQKLLAKIRSLGFTIEFILKMYPNSRDGVLKKNDGENVETPFDFTVVVIAVGI